MAVADLATLLQGRICYHFGMVLTPFLAARIEIRPCCMRSRRARAVLGHVGRADVWFWGFGVAGRARRRAQRRAARVRVGRAYLHLGPP